MIKRNKDRKVNAMVYVTGDTHGDYRRFNDPRLRSLQKDDILIVCGDFGFIWDGSRAEARTLSRLAKKKYTICFLDGTHENFDLLQQYPVEMWNGGKIHVVEDGVYHLMRGQVYSIGGLRYFTMGGGESPDYEIRVEHNTWSKAEIPTKQELLDAAHNVDKTGGQIDVILTHEPPLKIKGFLQLKENREAVRVTGLNTFFDELASFCKFQRWFFGALHEDKFISSSHIAVFQNIVNAETGELLQ